MEQNSLEYLKNSDLCFENVIVKKDIKKCKRRKTESLTKCKSKLATRLLKFKQAQLDAISKLPNLSDEIKQILNLDSNTSFDIAMIEQQDDSLIKSLMDHKSDLSIYKQK